MAGMSMYGRVRRTPTRVWWDPRAQGWRVEPTPGSGAPGSFVMESRREAEQWARRFQQGGAGREGALRQAEAAGARRGERGSIQ